MQRTTKMMFAHYITRGTALDVVWMRNRRARILVGDFTLAIVKPYHLYSGHPLDMVDSHLEYPSPLFDRARNQLHTGTQP